MPAVRDAHPSNTASMTELAKSKLLGEPWYGRDGRAETTSLGLPRPSACGCGLGLRPEARLDAFSS